ncbi:MAG: amidase, partial [Calditrichaeota bacterium]
MVHSEIKFPSITKEMVANAEKLIGLEFTEAERDSMLEGLTELRDNYQALREIELDNSVMPSLLFNPIPAGATFDKTRRTPRWSNPGKVTMPTNIEELAFYTVGQMAELIRTRKVTSEQLTRMYLNRLKNYGPKLECVITLTEDLALEQARRADAEIAAGKYRGPLHGIPYGAKDLLAVKGYPT